MSTPFEELVQKSEGELTTRRTAELDEALTRSPELREEQQRVEQLIGALTLPSPELAEVDLREGLWVREVPAAPRARRWPWVLGLAAAAAVVLALVLPRGSDEFGVKGSHGAPAGFDAFVMRDGAAKPLVTTMHRDDAVGFAYRNLPDSPWRALMLYGVDAQGRVFWFYPQWAEGEAPPKSVAIVTSSTRVELPDAVKHELSTGPLVLHALFSKQPLLVTDIEGGRIPTDVQHLTTTVEVTP